MSKHAGPGKFALSVSELRNRVAMMRGRSDVFARIGDHIRANTPILRSRINPRTTRLHKDDPHMRIQSDNALAWQKRDHSAPGRPSPWGNLTRFLPGRLHEMSRPKVSEDQFRRRPVSSGGGGGAARPAPRPAAPASRPPQAVRVTERASAPSRPSPPARSR